jgi:hypothetical protein
MISRHVIFILSTYNNGLLIGTIDASDLLFRYQREDSVHQLPFQGVFWSSRTIFNTVRAAHIAKLACGFHFVDFRLQSIASKNWRTESSLWYLKRRSEASIVTRIDKWGGVIRYFTRWDLPILRSWHVVFILSAYINLAASNNWFSTKL